MTWVCGSMVFALMRQLSPGAFGGSLGWGGFGTSRNIRVNDAHLEDEARKNVRIRCPESEMMFLFQHQMRHRSRRLSS